MIFGSHMQCPMCAGRIDWIQVRAGSTFLCPNCEAPLRIPRAYSRRRGILVLAIGVISSIKLGLTGWKVLAVTVLTFVPVGLVVQLFSRFFLPPALEAIPDRGP